MGNVPTIQLREPKRQEVTVQIGENRAVYVLVKTSAPKEYDAFGTLEVKSYMDNEKEPHRYVLIAVDHLEWHKGRYGSGLYYCEVQEQDRSIKGWIEQRLWSRITREED